MQAAEWVGSRAGTLAKAFPLLSAPLLARCTQCRAAARLTSPPIIPPALQVLAGHSIDVGEAAACRLRALSFLEAAATAMSCLLQHLRG